MTSVGCGKKSEAFPEELTEVWIPKLTLLITLDHLWKALSIKRFFDFLWETQLSTLEKKVVISVILSDTLCIRKVLIHYGSAYLF